MAALLSVEEARALLLDGAAPLQGEVIPIAQARGRVLAEAVRAKRDQPFYDISAMDGYAVATTVPPGKHRFTTVGTAVAGEAYATALGAGEAVRIFTGGVVPAGARVVVQEQAERDGDEVTLSLLPGDPSHVRPAGSDYAAGDQLLARGERLSGARLAILAAADVATVDVRRRPRVVVMSSGDELAPPGEAGDRVVNSGAYGVAGLIEAWGGEATIAPILPDDLSVCAERFTNLDAAQADLVITIGGASVGERDVLRRAAEEADYAVGFAGVAVRPGKPLWSATRRGAPRILGVPGNPASAMVGTRLFAVPIVTALLGQSMEDCLATLTAYLTAEASPNGDRETYLRARLSFDDAGRIAAQPAPSQDSGLMTPFSAGGALLRRLIGADIAREGCAIEALPIEPWPWSLAS